ncbi:hypothetical protein Afil01_15660 [Actinorhabdospora filicis]|uniref:ABC transporter domain-containing protein n=1 Tax=Actinorhabdospora filicis TaxID=1785913 RepID=A0A9W6W7P0_9ACTN|nr:ATP-binding cassette domain-containing protein [Actinorhabdospora filicis]GLZ76759.1 hypothetical protein Afil01_15660 [Actinorhabdospora filicis]
MLELRGLSRVFGSLTAVDGVSLTVSSRHALIGPNGAGKSTLLHLAAGNVRPSAGRVLLDGRDVTRAGPGRRARLGLGRTFQTPALVDSADCGTNLRLGGRAPVSLDDVGLGGCERLPAGALPHGRRRLLEVAVALAGAPRVLLLDEPAAGLGDDDRALLLSVLRAVEVPVLLVEHDQAFVRAYADTVTVLHQGALLASGTPSTIAADADVAAVYQGAAC